MNDPNEKTGTEATTETKDEGAPRPVATVEVSDAELARVSGGVTASVGGPPLVQIVPSKLTFSNSG